MRHLIALLIFGVVGSPAWSEAQGESEADPSAEEVVATSEAVRLKVPSVLRGKGYKLRFDDNIFDLETEQIEVQDDGNFVALQLLAADGRVLAGEEVFLQEQVLKDFGPTQFRLGLYIGGVTVEGTKFYSLFQDRLASEQSIDFQWLPGAFGLSLSLAGISSLEEYDPAVTSDFSELQYRLGAVYQWVPLRKMGGLVSWLHLALNLSAIQSKSWIRVGDGLVDFHDDSRSNGFFASVELLFPLYNFWLSVRSYASWSKIKFEQLDYDATAIRRGLLLGGMYAF